jgi:large subunit ribosomal protein L6
MKNSKKKYSVKVPKNIKILYCNEKNLITFIGPLATKSLSLKIKLLLIPPSNLIIATSLPTDRKSITGSKSSKKMQGTTIAKIKQILIEVTYVLSRKLNLVGVGYRAFSYEKLPNQMYLKLGYSHLIYFRIPTGVSSNCLKFTKIFIYGDKSYDLLTQTAAQIRSCKLPEPYKGKGVLYDQETIVLKKGKKI